MGVDVTLCASGDSQTSARLRWTYDRSLRTADDLENPAPYDWMHCALALKEAQGDYDIVHNHAGELAMAMDHLSAVPMLTTMHCQVTPDTRFVWDRYEGWYNTVSFAQRRLMPDIRGGTFAGVVYNAINVETFPFQKEKEDYLLFLSRISPEKGPEIAIDVAHRTGARLLIAGKVDNVDRAFFESVIEPRIDGDRVVFLGEADASLKRQLYRSARCLLLPLQWDEPFGLVMAEAMACGTPVVAFARGAAPEIIGDGETGFLVHNLDEMVRAVERVDLIDPLACRVRVEERFSPPVMAWRYLDLYERVLAAADRRQVFMTVPQPVSRPIVPAGDEEMSTAIA
jgi:glycosyltransferase involved in cell wall biosynthesis